MKKVFYLFLLIMALSAGANIAYGDNAAVITIYNPSIGVEWVRGTNYNITWYYGYDYDVKIELLGAAGYVRILTTTGQFGTYSWDIDPVQPVGSYRIRITSMHNPATTTTSGYFKILANNPNLVIAIYNPAVGVEWIRGYDYNITWWDNVDEDVKIDLIGPGATSTITTVITAGVASNGTFAWTIPPATAPGTYRIKITSLPSGGAPATSVTSGIFKILAGNPNEIITLYNPAIGVEWVRGFDYHITWWDNIGENVDIALLGPGGTSTATTPVATNIADLGSYPWTIPAGTVPGTYRIKITSHSAAGTSVTSGIFKVLASDPNEIITLYNPAVGVEWVKGFDYHITWWDNIGENVDIVLLGPGGTSTATTPVATDIVDFGSYLWTIPAGTVPGTYRIKITSRGVGGTSVTSGRFKILAFDPNLMITLYNPALGVEWVEGYDYNITWWDNIGENVKIELLGPGATSTNTTTLSPPGGAPSFGTFAWTIPAYPTTAIGTYRIRITSLGVDGTTLTSGIFKIIMDGKKSSNIDPANLSLSIYPNPASDKLNITSATNMNRVWLLNQLGKTVLETTVNSNQTQLDVSGLSSGIYIVKIETEGSMTTHKVIIR